MAKIITLRVGDRLRALVDRPYGASILRDDIVEVVGFGAGNTNQDHSNACPVLLDEYNYKWYTELRTLFKNFKKETK